MKYRVRNYDNQEMERLRNLFISLFDEDGRGRLMWKTKQSNAIPAGTTITRTDPYGRSIVEVKRKCWLVEDVVYLMHTGELPPMIQHINGNRQDNRFENLRAVGIQQMTQESLREWFDVTETSLSWKELNRPTQFSIGSHGYPVIRFAGGPKLVHRMMFIAHHGYEPVEIDHVDGNKLNYSIQNLRECSSAENSCNTQLRSDNTSGFKGVHFDRQNNTWRASVAFKGKHIIRTGFVDKEDAYKFVVMARQQLHGQFANHG